MEATPNVETAHCKRCEQDKPLTREHWYARKDGTFYTSYACKTCQRDISRARKLNGAPSPESRVPMARQLPASVIRVALADGGYRYDAILADGTTRQLRRSSKLCTYASAYTAVRDDDGRDLAEPEGPVVYLHGREDLAKRGDPQTNRAIAQGVSCYERIPGVVAIVES